MSRTYRKSKKVGTDFWSARKGNPANGVGKVAKKIAHKAERKVGNFKNQIKKEDLIQEL